MITATTADWVCVENDVADADSDAILKTATATLAVPSGSTGTAGDTVYLVPGAKTVPFFDGEDEYRLVKASDVFSIESAPEE